MKGPSGYVEIAHTADWALKVWAPDLTGLMHSSVQGMYALSGMVFGDVVESKVRFSIRAIDEESLLVEFLNEILFYAESKSLGLDKFMLRLEGDSVFAEASGRPILQRKKEIKAVTYHNLHIKEGPNGKETVLVFDV